MAKLDVSKTAAHGIHLGFARSAVTRISIAGIDLVLHTADGVDHVLPGLALQSMAEPGLAIEFSDGNVPANSLMSDAGHVDIDDAVNLTVDESSHAASAPNAEASGEPVQETNDHSSDFPPPPPSGMTAVDLGADLTKKADLSSAPPPPPTVTVVNTGAFSSPPAPPGVPPPPPDAPKIVVRAQVYNVTGQDVSAGSGGSTITGSGGSLASANDHSNAAQAAPEVIDGTAGNDTIMGDGGQGMGGGYARYLEIDTTGSSKVTVTEIQISGLPNTWNVVGATLNGEVWTLKLPTDPTQATHLPVMIQYAVASDAAPFTPTAFDLKIAVAGTMGGKAVSAIQTLPAIFRDVQGPADLSYTGPSGAPGVVFPAFGIGDLIHAGAGNDSVAGMVGADTLYGGDGADTLDGGASNDLLVGGAGADALIGGTGRNTASYEGSAFAVLVDLASGKGQGGDAEGDSLLQIQNLIGSDLNDTLLGDNTANSLAGGAGDDVLDGRGGADTLDGGAGFNTVSYADSNVAVSVDLGKGSAHGGFAEGNVLSNIQAVIGSDFNDTLVAGAAGSSLFGGAGDDLLTGASGADTLDGGAGNNTASYQNSSAGVSVSLAAGKGIGGDAQGDVLLNVQNLTGSSGDDLLLGDEKANLLNGGLGNDTLGGGAGADSLIGGGGRDWASYQTAQTGVTVSLANPGINTGDAAGDQYTGIHNLLGSQFADRLIADDSGDVLSGGPGNDTLLGGAANDTLIGGSGADSLDGAGGSNTGDYSASQDAVSVDLSGATANRGGDAQGDVLTRVQNLVGSQFNDSLVGDAVANRLDGNGGNDTLQGGAGGDTLVGGFGFSVASYSVSALGVTVNLATGVATGGDAQGDLLQNISGVIGSQFNDMLTGANGSSVLDGQGGNDTLSAGLGNTTLLGGAGNDSLIAGPGADSIDGGTGTDSLSYGASTQAVNVVLNDAGMASVSHGGLAEGDVVTGIEVLIGSAGNDTLVASSDDNLLQGGNGNDLLVAGSGADTLDGGAGTNTVSYQNASAAVTASTLAQSGSIAGGPVDRFLGIQNLTGGAYNDSLTGDSGANVLAGGAGNDTIDGGGGRDVLDGGSGFNMVTYADSTAAVTVNLATNQAFGGYAQGNTLSNFQAVTGSNYNDFLVAAGGSRLDGGLGNDTLVAGTGNDTLTGGGGIDTASFVASTAGVTVNLATGVVSGGSASGDVLSGITNLIGSATAGSLLTGDANNNVLSGGSGDDTLVGGAGADTLIGGAGVNLADYRASSQGVVVNLTLSGAQASPGDASGDVLQQIQSVTGSATGANLLTGDGNNNVLTGGAANDTLVGGAGADTLVGNGGSDLADYSSSVAGVTVDLTQGGAQQSTGDASGDVLSGITHLKGSASGASFLTGDANANVLTGGSGNDTLMGGAGADTLVGNGGIDTADYATSTAGVTVNLATGVNSGGDATGDVLNAIRNVMGSATAASLLIGNSSANILSGGLGNDTLIGGAGGQDTLIGAGGSDLADFSASAQGVTVDLTLATAQLSAGDASGDVLNGIENVTGSSTAANVLTGNASANRLTGGSGNDSFNGSVGGHDTILGNGGTDLLSFASSGAGVTVNLGLSGAQSSTGDANGDVLSGITHLTGSATGANLLTGDGNANVLTGGSANDTLAGSTGGHDTLIGGGGNNLADFSASAAGVTVNLASTTAQSGGDAAGDILQQIQNVTGSATAINLLIGNAGANQLSGGTANDTLIGGTGGHDTLIGGGGVDLADFSSSTSGVTVNLGLGTAQISGGDANGDVLIGISNVTGAQGAANLLTGSAGANVLTGGSGSDTLIGGAGADTLIGNGGTDTASYVTATQGVTVNLATGVNSGGDAAGDLLVGISNLTGSGTAASLLTGDANNNVLSGGSGDDTLAGGAGADTLIGGAGVNLADYRASSQGVVVNLTLSGAQASPGDASGDVLQQIQSVTGSATGANLLTGDGNNNVLTGGAANDTLVGGAGADTLVGNGGSDLADYSSSVAGVTVDLTQGGAQQSTGDASGDVLSGITHLKGSASGASFLTGDANANVLTGGSGNDTLMGGAGADTLVGNGGIDTADYATSTAGVTVNLATGVNSGGDATGDVLNAIRNVMGSATAASLLIGNSSANILSGGLGNDTLIGGAGGQDTLIGGGGSDLADFSASGQGVTVNLSLATAQASPGDASGDVLSGIANVAGAATAANLLIGDFHANQLIGGSGNDTLAGGAGADTLIGAGGIDTADYSSSSAGVTVNLTLTSAQASNGDASGDVLSGFSNVTGSATGANRLVGDTNANLLVGGNGNDTLNGGAGADTLIGGAGTNTADYADSAAGVTVNLGLSSAQSSPGDAGGDVLQQIQNVSGAANAANLLTGDANGNVLTGGTVNDTLIGGAGADTLIGGGGNDVASYASSTQGVTVNLGLTGAQSSLGDAAGDQLAGVENLIGSVTGANRLTGDASANQLSGGNGNDTLIGAAGADTLVGGGGNDLADYSASTAGVTVNLSNGGAQSGGDAAGDILSGIANLTGSAIAANQLTGDSGNNVLTGGSGNDTLAGGAGADTLTGGGGSNTADYSASALGVTVNLAMSGPQASPGDASGDVLVQIQNVTGSAIAANVLIGDTGANLLTGGAGNDTLTGGVGADTLIGGGGSDVASYASSVQGVTVNLNLSGAQVSNGDAAGDVLAGIANVTGAASAASLLIGDAKPICSAAAAATTPSSAGPARIPWSPMAARTRRLHQLCDCGHHQSWPERRSGQQRRCLGRRAQRGRERHRFGLRRESADRRCVGQPPGRWQRRRRHPDRAAGRRHPGRQRSRHRRLVREFRQRRHRGSHPDWRPEQRGRRQR